jgi:hypothetical protein
MGAPVTDSLHGIDAALKEYFSRDLVDRLGYKPNDLWFKFIHPRGQPPPHPGLAIPIAATMAIAGLGWLIARRNALGAAPSRTFYEAAADWLAMIVAMLFPKEPPCSPA